jgi:diaminopimelate epimerase
MDIEFAKLSGSGNDFICLDNRDGRFDELIASPPRAGCFARTLCRRGLGVGADGLLFACAHDVGDLADIAARLFEPDGSETELCGNGLGCFVHWAAANGWVGAGETNILTPAGVVRGQRADGRYVRVCIPVPEAIRHDVRVDADGRRWHCDVAVLGVPHAVAYVEHLDALDVARCGRAIRHHPRFAPRGVNANFVKVLRAGEIAVRTFEFGVEGETLACGTGSAASAILTTIRFGWGAPYATGEQPVLVRARSGDVLRVCFRIEADGRAVDACLDTVVRFIYRGTLHPELAARALKADAG